MDRRKGIVIFFLLTALLMGCSATENKIKIEIPTFVPEVEKKTDKLSGMADWDDVKIVDIGFYPRFQEGTVVQNDKYIFYPDSGNKIMRIEKKNREKKCILELDKIREKGTGAQVCIAGDRLLVEYECDIFRCDFDGNKREKIIGSVDVKKKISSVPRESMENESGIMASMQFYKGKLYLFSSWDCIWKVDPDSGKFTRIAESAQTACFSNNNLYYGDSYCECIYRLNLKTGKKVRIRGKNADSEKEYTSVMAVDNQIYYVCNQKGKESALYLYCEGGKDKKLFTFQRPWASHVDLTKVFLEYYEFSSRTNYLQVYDIKSHKATTMKMPYDFQTVAFLAGDVLFYTSRDSKDICLSAYTLPEDGWEETN